MAKFKTPDGLNLYYEDTGQGTGKSTGESIGAGTPIVFVHEFGGDHRSWHLQLAALSSEFRCITYSARGFKPSDIPEDRQRYGQASATADLLALMDHLGIATAHVVGTSMGSFTSLDFALCHSDRVASVTLVGNSSGPRDDTERTRYRQDWIGRETQLRQEKGSAGAVAVLEEDPAYRSFQDDVPEAWAIYAENLRGQSVEGAVHVLSTVHWNRRSLFDDVAALEAFERPVMLITGDDDYYLVEETNAFLNATLPDVRWHRFPATGHMVNIERAAAFNQHLADFVRQV